MKIPFLFHFFLTHRPYWVVPMQSQELLTSQLKWSQQKPFSYVSLVWIICFLLSPHCQACLRNLTTSCVSLISFHDNTYSILGPQNLAYTEWSSTPDFIQKNQKINSSHPLLRMFVSLSMAKVQPSPEMHRLVLYKFMYLQTFLDIVMPQSHLTPALRRLASG